MATPLHQEPRQDAKRLEADSEPTRRASALKVRGLTKVYGSGSDAVRAVDGIDLEVERGKVVGLLGPNGAGKTTVIKMLLGLIEPTAGEVRVAGVDVSKNRRAVYRSVGAMLEGARNIYWRLTVRENLRFFAALGGQDPSSLSERHTELLEHLNLDQKAEDPVNELSRGMKQKVSLACTLARDTSLAFLDEPTLGLDVESSLELRRELRRLARERDMTVILSSHDLDVIEDLCDRVVILNEGRVIADDEVASLIDVFQTQAYEITVDHLPRSVEQRLDRQFKLGEIESLGEKTTLEVHLDGSGAFYDFVDVLRAANLSISEVSSIDPDLEDVFIEMTNGESAPEVPGQ